MKWFRKNANLAARYKFFTIEAIRGGRTVEEDQGDICMDNFVIELGRCREWSVNA